jgi:hypothetical protein
MVAIIVAIYGFDGAAIWNLQHLLEPSYFKPRSVAVEIKSAIMNFISPTTSTTIAYQQFDVVEGLDNVIEVGG